MSTAAQINANQLNAQSSTGPRTPEGKSVVSQNATKHGLTATYPVIRTPSEQTQFKQLILAAWNIDRCHRLEAELALTTGIDPLIDETQSKTLASIEAYRLRAERLFHRILKELKALDKNRYIPQIKPNFPTPIYSHTPRTTTKIGRNEPCPCKSGKKYKFCCINSQPTNPLQATSCKRDMNLEIRVGPQAWRLEKLIESHVRCSKAAQPTTEMLRGKFESKAKASACEFKQSLNFLNYISSLISHLQESNG